jgi:hypothetical protein
VPYPCLKHRPSPVISGQQGSASKRHDGRADDPLSWTDERRGWSIRGAGDRDRTGMASLEGLRLSVAYSLVNGKSGGCRAFRVPQRQMAGRGSGSSLSLGQRAVECCGSRRHRCPRRPGE